MLTKQLGPGTGFGEIALLYNDKRTATIKAIGEKCSVWVLEGRVFKNIIIKQSISRRNIELGFLERVPLLQNLDKFDKMKLIDGLEVKYFAKGQNIITEGEEGNYFYIIEDGKVDCQKKIEETGEEKFVRSLVKGEHFGEIALINQVKRTLSVVAKSDTVKLLALNRESFNRILGTIDRYLKKDYDAEFEKRVSEAEVVIPEE